MFTNTCNSAYKIEKYKEHESAHRLKDYMKKHENIIFNLKLIA